MNGSFFKTSFIESYIHCFCDEHAMLSLSWSSNGTLLHVLLLWYWGFWFFKRVFYPPLFKPLRDLRFRTGSDIVHSLLSYWILLFSRGGGSGRAVLALISPVVSSVHMRYWGSMSPWYLDLFTFRPHSLGVFYLITDILLAYWLRRVFEQHLKIIITTFCTLTANLLMGCLVSGFLYLLWADSCSSILLCFFQVV